jgi:hypothetical protein
MSQDKKFSQWAIDFNQGLLKIQEKIKLQLPEGYQLMNPFLNGEALAISESFYRLFYDDSFKRKIIFGINPGRHGAGLTGVPFTDSKHLASINIDARGIKSFEPSSVFIYQVIEKFSTKENSGAKNFFQKFYINSPLPLGLLQKNQKGNLVNANYYDNKNLQKSVEPMIEYTMLQYQKMPIDTEICYCLGQGKNYQYLQKWNKQNQIFKNIIPLAHPRYIMQYKHQELESYKEDYLKKLTSKNFE